MAPNDGAKDKQGEHSEKNDTQEQHPPSEGISHAILVDDWKLVFDITNDQPAALYDLNADLGEQKNLIADPTHAERVKRMLQCYREIRQSKRSTPAPAL